MPLIASSFLVGCDFDPLFDTRRLRPNFRSMKTLPALALAALLGIGNVASAADFGNAQDVKVVRKIVNARFGHALHASVSHDWALCTSYSGESSLSIVLHREAGTWNVVQQDGGAFAAENLKQFGVPAADIPQLLRAYQ